MKMQKLFLIGILVVLVGSFSIIASDYSVELKYDQNTSQITDEIPIGPVNPDNGPGRDPAGPHDILYDDGEGAQLYTTTDYWSRVSFTAPQEFELRAIRVQFYNPNGNDSPGFVHVYREDQRNHDLDEQILTIEPEAIFDRRWQVLEIDQHRQQNNGLLVHFNGFDDPETARNLTGLELVVDAEQLPGLEEGSFYWHELEGMEVCNEAGEVFGVIDRLMETGANDVLVVAPYANSIDDRERLIPYIKDSVIKSIDATERKILVNWEADYLE